MHTITTHKTKEFEFIFQHINVDDSITQIAKNFYVFGTAQDFIIENNQELAVNKSTIKFIRLSLFEFIIKRSLLSELKPIIRNCGKNGQIILGETLINNNDTTYMKQLINLILKAMKSICTI